MESTTAMGEGMDGWLVGLVFWGQIHLYSKSIMFVEWDRR